MPAILCNKHCYVREEVPKPYVTILFQQINTHRGKCQDRASPIQIHRSLSPPPTGYLDPPPNCPSAGPLLGCCSADCAELSLRPLIVSGGADSPRVRRPQEETVCRWLGSRRKWGARWESTGRKAMCRLVMQAERGCHRRAKHDTWYERHLGVQMTFMELDSGRKGLTYRRYQFWDCCGHVCTDRCWNWILHDFTTYYSQWMGLPCYVIEHPSNGNAG